MMSFRSIANRRRSVAVGTLAAALAACLGGAPEAGAAEVAPQLSLTGGLVLGSFSAPSLAGDGDFACFVSSQDPDGSFTCALSGSPTITGRVVGITDGFGTVVGHVVRMSRQASSTTIERFEAAIARTGDDAPHTWMAGSVERTTRVRQCGSFNRCITFDRTSGPLPFTAEVFSIGG